MNDKVKPLPQHCILALWDIVQLVTALDTYQHPTAFSKEERVRWREVLDYPQRYIMPCEREHGELPSVTWQMCINAESQEVTLTRDLAIKYVIYIWPYLSTTLMASAHPLADAMRYSYGLEIDILEARFGAMVAGLDPLNRGCWLEPEGAAKTIEAEKRRAMATYRPSYTAKRPTNTLFAVQLLLAAWGNHQFLLRNGVDPMAVPEDTTMHTYVDTVRLEQNNPLLYRPGKILPIVDIVRSNMASSIDQLEREDGSVYVPKVIVESIGEIDPTHALRRPDELYTWKVIRGPLRYARAPGIINLLKYFEPEIAEIEDMLTQRGDQ